MAAEYLIFEEIEFGHYKVRFSDEVTKDLLMQGASPAQIKQYLENICDAAIERVLEVMEIESKKLEGGLQFVTSKVKDVKGVM